MQNTSAPAPTVVPLGRASIGMGALRELNFTSLSGY